VWAVTVAVTLLGFGVPTLHAKQNHCIQQQSNCPAPVLREKPTAPPAETCCPIDPKDVHKAQKSAEHAQHEAAEACKRQQKEAAKAQARIDRAQAKAEHELGEANAKLEKRRSDWQQANEELAALSSGPSSGEVVAEVKQPEPEIERSKPVPEAPVTEPLPEPVQQQPMPQAMPQSAPAPTPEATSTNAPTPETTSTKVPKQLPKTGSDLELIGLIGVLSTMTGYLTRFFRG